MQLKFQSKIIILMFLMAPLISCKKKAPLTHIQTEKKTMGKKVGLMPENTQSYESLINAGLSFAKQQKFKEALKKYNLARQVNPQAPLAWNNICAAFNEQSLFSSAIPYCKKTLRLEKQLKLAENNLNHALSQLTKLKKNKQQEKKEASQVLLDRGLSFYNEKDFSLARDFWQLVPTRDPFFALAQNNIASSFLEEKKTKLAEKHLLVALQLEPKNKLFLANKKWLESEKKAFK